MKNTEYNLDAIYGMISSEDSLGALLGIISDMDLVIRDVRTA